MRRLTLDLDVLRSFVLGIELGSFAKAADRLGRSTSAISAQLKKLEEQIGAAVLRKSGRGMVLTPDGEILFGYAKRLLALNDEAVAAVQDDQLHGSVRLGLQEDFGAQLLTETLGRFARAHPYIQIEVRVARNAELLDLVNAGRLDLALAWDSGQRTAHSQYIAELPLSWIGLETGVSHDGGQPVPLVAFDAPCLMRSAACQALEQADIAWRVAFTSPSLSSIWAAVAAGLGITVRTRIGLPAHLHILQGMPKLPKIGLMLHQSVSDPTPAVQQLAAIILEEMHDAAA
jgi:DNA-binding transcriptional LysR family regulator